MLGPAMSERTFCVASHQTSVDSQTLPVRPLATASHINVDRTGRIITRSVISRGGVRSLYSGRPNITVVFNFAARGR